VVVASNSALASTGGGATVYCSSPHAYALGGGGTINKDLALESSVPVKTQGGTPVGWEVSYAGTNGDPTTVITAYVICAR
jgi:hypothetical protein